MTRGANAEAQFRDFGVAAEVLKSWSMAPWSRLVGILLRVKDP